MIVGLNFSEHLPGIVKITVLHGVNILVYHGGFEKVRVMLLSFFNNFLVDGVALLGCLH